MSATSYERMRREAAANKVLKGVSDKAAFIRANGLACTPATLHQYLSTLDRVSVERMTRDVSRPEFDLSGPWMRTRARVRDALGLETAPASKREAVVLLTDAGYEVAE